VGFTLFSREEEMQCIELSGYWTDATSALSKYPHADRITQTVAIDRGKYA
jgi:hypothetical protein